MPSFPEPSFPDANANPSPTFALWKKLSSLPGGTRLFSAAICAKAPYFATILPHITQMRPGFCVVKAPKWFGVNNHIKTFHAIAACNVAETAMGMLAEASVPASHRWLPQGMRVKYLTKSKGSLKATATAELPDFGAITKESGGKTVTVTIAFVDASGAAPVEAEIDIWVTAKK